MTNRFQGLDLIDRVPEELWTQRFVIWYRRQVAQTVKVSVYNVGDLGSSPGLGRSPGEGNGNPLQYYCLEIPWTEEPGRLQSMGSQRVGHD